TTRPASSRCRVRPDRADLNRGSGFREPSRSVSSPNHGWVGGASWLTSGLDNHGGKPMSLVINTNVAALNAYKNLNNNQSMMNDAIEKLSSGLRINKAADDAA